MTLSVVIHQFLNEKEELLNISTQFGDYKPEGYDFSVKKIAGNDIAFDCSLLIEGEKKSFIVVMTDFVDRNQGPVNPNGSRSDVMKKMINLDVFVNNVNNKNIGFNLFIYANMFLAQFIRYYRSVNNGISYFTLKTGDQDIVSLFD